MFFKKSNVIFFNLNLAFLHRGRKRLQKYKYPFGIPATDSLKNSELNKFALFVIYSLKYK
ncbi:MAG: hypothetical protein ACJA2M_001044 [Polaribacter sp.]|jgi:hypothetical protein